MSWFRAVALATIVILVTSTNSMSAGRDIVDTAVKAGDFKTFLAAVSKTGLLETLRSEGPFTVFAPTDKAFAKLGATLSELLLPENKAKLTRLLSYHILKGEVLEVDLKEGFQPATVQGGIVKFGNAGAIINGVNITYSDIMATNGVIHAIDKVLVPPAVDQ